VRANRGAGSLRSHAMVSRGGLGVSEVSGGSCLQHSHSHATPRGGPGRRRKPHSVRLDNYLPDQTMLVQVLVYEFDFDLAVFSPSLNRDYTACPVVLTARARKAGYMGGRGAAAGRHTDNCSCEPCFVPWVFRREGYRRTAV